jgi:hypothetical protein
MHQDLAKEFHNHNSDNAFSTDAKVLDLLEGLEKGKGVWKYSQNENATIKVEHFSLQDLLAKGSEGFILRTILTRNIYGDRFSLERIKPLIRVVICMDPEMLTERYVPRGFQTKNYKGNLPLCEILDDDPEMIHYRGTFGPEEKEDLIAFFCDHTKLGSTKASDLAVKSLTMVSRTEYCVHKAIKQGLHFPMELIKKLSELKAYDEEDQPSTISCLELPCDEKNTTCLHLALNFPKDAYTDRNFPIRDNNDKWARKLAELHPNLLKAQMKRADGDSLGGSDPTLTPLQYLKVQTPVADLIAGEKTLGPEESKKPKSASTTPIDELERFLKQQCLTHFDANTCKEVMYPRAEGMSLSNVTARYMTWETISDRKQLARCSLRWTTSESHGGC